MKVIFLDIDGVLNTSKTRNPRKLPYVAERKLIKRLVNLANQTRSKVVLSSTWRYDPAGLFSAKRLGIPFIDITPDMPSKTRNKKVLRWLKKHPRVSRFVVIDDEDDGLDDLSLFQPDAAHGLTPDVAAAARRYLERRSEEDLRRGKAVRLLQNVRAVVQGHKG